MATLACAQPGSSSGNPPSVDPCPASAAAGTCNPLGAAAATTPFTFAIVGDTRPANVDDTAGYPTAIIDGIYTSVAARTPQPAFVVSTGDYQFASVSGSESAPQLDLYLAARAKFPGVMLPAMGNHECTGYTSSNCGFGNKDGFTTSYTAFLEKMLRPIDETLPYYLVTLGAADHSWTAKLVFVAANAWDATQAAWLETSLSIPTTYTFVVRHESADATTAPGTMPSEAIVKAHPFTLEICGHSHTYKRWGNRVLFGNGGAPLTGDKGYGYGIVQQEADGTVVVDAIDYATGEADPTFHFAVNADGSTAE